MLKESRLFNVVIKLHRGNTKTGWPKVCAVSWTLRYTNVALRLGGRGTK